MNLSRFFEHWAIAENPFRDEEARQDPVFQKLEEADAPARDAKPTHATHSDFEKIVGDFRRPATSIVFGEKGSGKTAIRLQLSARAEAFNRENPQHRVLLVEYDDLNPVLDRFVERMSGRDKETLKTLERFRLNDHVDAMLTKVVPPIVDALIGPSGSGTPMDLGDGAKRAARRVPDDVKRDLCVLQAVYDRPERAGERAKRLRGKLGLRRPIGSLVWDALAYAGWVLPLGVLAIMWPLWMPGDNVPELSETWETVALVGVSVGAAAWLVGLFKKFVWDKLAFGRLAHKIRRQVRVSGRDERSYADALARMHPHLRAPGGLPVTSNEDTRYAMIERLRRVGRVFGFESLLILVDRVDEPTAISGDPERMKAIVWPLLNHKFLQQDRLGVKMLLPIELRYALFRESSAFFQSARLDKQNLIERLTWTGAMLYDLCNARLSACRRAGSEPITLRSLFEEDVTRQDLVDALDQMHQPRDAFKLVYQCLAEHCSNVTEEEESYRIPRLVLETVRKAQSERVRQLYRGVRPA